MCFRCERCNLVHPILNNSRKHRNHIQCGKQAMRLHLKEDPLDGKRITGEMTLCYICYEEVKG